MAELLYNEEGRLLFTEEMKKEYTLLMPQMLPVHFTMLKKVFELEGYKVDMLTTNHRGIVDEGLKYVHNDTCYPALLVICQLLLLLTVTIYIIISIFSFNYNSRALYFSKSPNGIIII